MFISYLIEFDMIEKKKSEYILYLFMLKMNDQDI